MANYYIVCSVASVVHKRKIRDHLIKGLSLAQAVAAIDVYDSFAMFGNEYLDEPVVSRSYDGNDKLGWLKVNTDRSHWYAVVFGEGASEKADEILAEFDLPGQDPDDND